MVIAPRLRFMKQTNKAKKNAEENGEDSNDEEPDQGESEEEEEEEEEDKPKSKKAALAKKSAGSFSNLGGNHDDDAEDDLFTVKRVITPRNPKTRAVQEEEEESEEDEEAPVSMLSLMFHLAFSIHSWQTWLDSFQLETKKIKIKSKAAVVKAIKKKNLKVNEKVLFDDEDNVIRTNINQRNVLQDYAKELEEKPTKEAKPGEKQYGGIDIEEAKEYLKREQEVDKKLFRERVKREHRVSPVVMATTDPSTVCLCVSVPYCNRTVL